MLHKIRAYFPVLLILIAITGIIVVTATHQKVIKSKDLAPLVSANQKLAVLLVFNGQHYIEAENLLASIKKNAPALLPYIQVCVSDSNSKDFAVRNNLRWFEMSTIKKSGGFSSYAMNVMTRRKLEAIIHLLEEKHDV